MKKNTPIYGWTCTQNGPRIIFSSHFPSIFSFKSNNNRSMPLFSHNPIEMIFRNRFFFLIILFVFFLCAVLMCHHTCSTPNWEKWLMNRIKQILKEINSICENWWNVKFFPSLTLPAVLYVLKALCTSHALLLLMWLSHGILPHEAQLGLRLYMEMYAVKRVASTHAAAAYFCPFSFSLSLICFCFVLSWEGMCDEWWNVFVPGVLFLWR